jgi:hypothetical protein
LDDSITIHCFKKHDGNYKIVSENKKVVGHIIFNGKDWHTQILLPVELNSASLCYLKEKVKELCNCKISREELKK